MAQQNLVFSTLSNSKFMDNMKVSSRTRTLTGTLTMVANEQILQFIDPGGANRDVRLPPEADGLIFIFVNTADAAEVLTIKDDSGTTTFATPTQAEAAILFCNGTTWGGLVGASS